MVCRESAKRLLRESACVRAHDDEARSPKASSGQPTEERTKERKNELTKRTDGRRNELTNELISFLLFSLFLFLFCSFTST
jgi:hypothetical protein